MATVKCVVRTATLENGQVVAVFWEGAVRRAFLSFAKDTPESYIQQDIADTRRDLGWTEDDANA